MSKSKFFVSYDNYLKKVNQIADELKKEIRDVHLIALYRGGLPIGVHLSNKLNVPLSIIDFQTRDVVGFTKYNEPQLIKNAGIKSNELLVIVDDIYDTGLTLENVRDFLFEEFPNNPVIGYALYRNEKNQKFDLPWVKTFADNGDKWVVFPWEV